MNQRLTTSAAATVVLALAALASPAPQNKQQEFEQRFARAAGINDRDEMAQLVRLYQNEAVVRVDVLCTQIAYGTSEALEKEIDLLTKAWRASMNTDFVENHYAYLSLMRPPTYRERERLRKACLAQKAKYFENVAGKKDGPTFELAAGELKPIAMGFEEIGDAYLAGEAWMIYGLCFVEEDRGREDADKRKVVEGYQGMIRNWGRIGLEHNQYQLIKAIHDRLVAEGWKDALDDPDAPPPGAPEEAAAGIALVMTFEPIKKLSQFERPSYFMDEMYQMWPSLFFQGRNASASIPSIEKGPLILRSESSALGIDSDRDGNAEDKLKLTGRLTVVEFDVHDGSGSRRAAILTATGQQQDKYQGLQVNLQPEDAQMSLYYVSAGSVVGMLGETPIRVIDDNLDGVYGSPPRGYSYSGLSEDNYQPDMDSVVIGSSKRAVPWSEYLKVGDAWYRMEAQNGGSALLATPMEVETGRLKLSFTGPPPVWMIVRGEATLENCFFDLLADGKGGTEVPAGSYQLYVGLVSAGKKQQVMKALVLPGEGTGPWAVEKDGEVEIELGAPFDFEFEYRAGEDSVTVVGGSVAIVGMAGERYERTWNCAPRPEVAVRKAGSKRGGKGKKMDVVMDLNEVGDDGGLRYSYTDTWRPLDTAFDTKYEEVEVQLVEKKNKLFGKIESAWK